MFSAMCDSPRKGVIEIDPGVTDLPARKSRFHRNVGIEGNHFEEQEKGPHLYARRVYILVWRANKVVGRTAGTDVKFSADMTGIAPSAAE
jgi:hypothetical protein